MSLFPAYASADDRTDGNNPYETHDENRAMSVDGSLAAMEYMESQLLASDDEAVADAGVEEVTAPKTVPSSLNEDFYLDTKLDPGNLRVSTLYYPGRPQYFTHEKSRLRARRRRRRYYEEVATGDGDDEAEVASRVSAYRRMLADAPCDEDLWLQFINFQERWRGGEEALRVSSEAVDGLPHSRRLRHARLSLAARHLPANEHLTLLRDHIAAEKSPGPRLELWVRLLTALAGSSACSAASVSAAARAALADLRAYPAAYPHVFYTYGAFLRSAGLWEQLVLLIELVTAMNYPPSPVFPPQADAGRLEDVERRLRDKEDKTIMSGMPLSAVWARVERARASAHWRPAVGCDEAELAADPQRAPVPADVADMLQPVTDPRVGLLLLVHTLRLAKVPLLPASEWLSRAAGGPAAAGLRGAGWAAGGGEALLAPLRAARRLPPAHPAHPARPLAAAAVLAHFLDPPHYFVDDSGYLSWVNSLWDACCGWLAGERRVALLCWRLRWLHSLMLLLDPKEEGGRVELRRLRGEARQVLRREGACGPLPFAQFARLELAAAGPEPARAAALHSLRAAAREHGGRPHATLYIARIVCEVCEPGDPTGTWAVASAALGLALPSDEQLQQPPPAELLRDALRTCEEKCDEIERDEAIEGEETEHVDELCSAMLPGVGEWAAARAHLAPPLLRAALIARALRAGAAASEPTRYQEQAACALVLAAAADHRAAHYARALAPRFPDNAFLALTAEGAPLWAWDVSSTEARLLRAGPPPSDGAAVCAVLAALVRAGPPAAWPEQEAARLARAARRAAAARAGGPLLHALKMEAEARRARPDLERALLTALDAQPHAKWLYVRGAQWCSGSAGSLPDVLLDKQLRLHALRDELEPVAPPPPTIT